MDFIFGLGLHVIVALFFAIHALRNGRPIYWLIVLFSFPVLGSIVYFLVEYVQTNKLNQGVQQVSKSALKLLDPSRELRDAEHAFDLTPTVQNRIRLASALDEVGKFEEAAAQFDACLDGPFANDLELCFMAAKAKLHNQQASEAIALLIRIRSIKDEFRSEQVSLLLAKSYAATKNITRAREEYISALNTFASTECKTAYALWAASVGDLITARNLRTDLEKAAQHWNKNTKSLYQPVLNEIDAAITAAENS